MGVEAVIRRIRQQDALDAACEAIEIKDRRIASQIAEIARLEAEILRLRKNTFAIQPNQVDNSVVKAKSTADVRRLTESAFSLQLKEEMEKTGVVDGE